jgi:hypothetical protein
MEHAAYHHPEIAVPRYPRTGRPITAMDFIRPLNSPSGIYLPVSRYPGLYHEHSETEYCGTFYYYEPDSINYLHLGNNLITGSKYGAMRYLEERLFGSFNELLSLQRGRFPLLLSLQYLLRFSDYIGSLISDINVPVDNPVFSIEYNLIDPQIQYVGPDYSPAIANVLRIFNPNVDDGLHPAIRNDLVKWSSGIHNLSDPKFPIYDSSHPNSFRSQLLINKLRSNMSYLSEIGSSISDLSDIQCDDIVTVKIDALGKNVPIQENRLATLFSKADFMDQQICRLARHFGFDTVILQREIGEKRIVTEVLDTRNREVSYQSFCRLRDNLMLANESAPTVWTTDLNFVKFP